MDAPLSASQTWKFTDNPPGMKLDMSAIIARMVALEEEATKAAVIAELRKQGYGVIAPDDITERHYETRGDGKVYTRVVGPWAEVTNV